jgi:hypothetical protein
MTRVFRPEEMWRWLLAATAGGARTDGPASVSELALQADSGGVRVVLMKRNLGSAKRGRLDISPKWVDIQTCLISC